MNFPADKVLSAAAGFEIGAKFDALLNTLKLEVDEDFTGAILSGNIGTRIASEWKLSKLIEKLNLAKGRERNFPLFDLIDQEIREANEAIAAIIDLESPELEAELRQIFAAADGDLDQIYYRVAREFPQHHQKGIHAIIAGFA